MSDKPLKYLTPHDRAKAEEMAWNGFVEQQKIYSPPPKSLGIADIINNRKVMNFLTKTVSFTPALLIVALAAAITVSLDKTAFAFHASVANSIQISGFDVWGLLVAAAAVIMVDASMAIAEFELVRDMLSKGLHRKVWSLADGVGALWMRIGYKPVKRGQKREWTRVQAPDYHEVEDGTLKFWNHFLFFIAIIANVYAVRETTGIALNSFSDLAQLGLSDWLLLATGIAGALTIRMVSRIVAHKSYESARRQETLENQELERRWKDQLLEVWQQAGVGEELVRQALHRAFLVKNRLPPDAESPFLLTAGIDEEGQPEIAATPFETSLEPSPVPSKSTSPNGSQGWT